VRLALAGRVVHKQEGRRKEHKFKRKEAEEEEEEKERLKKDWTCSIQNPAIQGKHLIIFTMQFWTFLGCFWAPPC
jgi:hypothetical protein